MLKENNTAIYEIDILDSDCFLKTTSLVKPQKSLTKMSNIYVSFFFSCIIQVTVTFTTIFDVEKRTEVII